MLKELKSQPKGTPSDQGSNNLNNKINKNTTEL
jgi:hypothetical protein